MSDSTVVLEVLKRALEKGHDVEIEGLGTFRRSCDSGYEFTAESRPQVFVAYVEEDLPAVRRLCQSLHEAGCSAWLDKEQLLAGQNWPRAIERAIDVADAFVACFSQRALAKRGQFQCELRYALDCAKRLPLGAGFLMPVRFEACEVPASIAKQTQYVDLFPNWERGVRRLARAIRKCKRNAGVELT